MSLAFLLNPNSTTCTSSIQSAVVIVVVIAIVFFIHDMNSIKSVTGMTPSLKSSSISISNDHYILFVGLRLFGFSFLVRICHWDMCVSGKTQRKETRPNRIRKNELVLYVFSQGSNFLWRVPVYLAQHRSIACHILNSAKGRALFIPVFHGMSYRIRAPFRANLHILRSIQFTFIFHNGKGWDMSNTLTGKCWNL